MRTRNWRLLSVLGILVLLSGIATSALAQCGVSTKLVKPASWNPRIGAAHRMRTAISGYQDDEEDIPSIVGMWHAVFTAHTMNGQAIPAPGAVVDNSLVVWHSDGTEIMNSARPAQDGNFCLGVWSRTGRLTYFLNHIPWLGNDLTNAPSGIGLPQAGAQILEKVTLSPSGDSYTGTFSLVAYNGAGQVAVSFTGTLAATRITSGTSITSLF